MNCFRPLICLSTFYLHFLFTRVVMLSSGLPTLFMQICDDDMMTLIKWSILQLVDCPCGPSMFQYYSKISRTRPSIGVRESNYLSVVDSTMSGLENHLIHNGTYTECSAVSTKHRRTAWPLLTYGLHSCCYKCLANAKRERDCSVLCLRPECSLCSCPHSICRHNAIRQRCGSMHVDVQRGMSV